APGGASSVSRLASRSSTPSSFIVAHVSWAVAYGRFPDAGRLWHKKDAMALFKARRAPPPLNEEKLGELALRYVGRFATTRAKLRSYLERKLRERGWDGARAPDPEGLAERFASLGYIDDAGFALAKSRALTGRGYGTRRVDQALRVAGIDEDDGVAARE